MRKTKLEKGITLVALIITIVVLLILAVVSIGAVKNSGIIGHASNTTARWEQEQTNEASDLKDYEDFLEENNPNKKSPYEDFWQKAYELYEENKDDWDYCISEHLYCDVAEEGGVLLYGDNLDTDTESDHKVYYYMCSIDWDEGSSKVIANEWYTAISGSEFDFSKTLGLPTKVLEDKAGTPVAGYKELCDLFNKAVETHAENIKANQ